MPHFNLPPFKTAEDRETQGDGANFANAEHAGAWIKATGSLSELASSLRDTGGGDLDNVKSAPDPWAQPRTFADALTRSGHPLAASVRREWRGLLALFALEKCYETVYAISPRAVDLSGKSRFERVLTALLPSPRLPQAHRTTQGAPAAAEWNRPVLIDLKLVAPSSGAERRFRDVITLGMFNPACLVSVGRKRAGVTVAGIPWMRSGITDPTQLTGDDKLPVAQLAILREYALELRQGLLELAENARSEQLTAIAAQLNELADDCDRQGAADAPIGVTVGRPQATRVLPPLYQLLQRSVTADAPDDAASTSECRIDLRADLARQPFRGVILVDRALSGALGKTVQNIIVWGAASLSSVLDNPVGLAALRAEAAAAGYLVVTPDDIFTKVLLKLGKSAMVAGNPDTLRDVVLPLSPLALLLQSPAQLSQNVASVDEAGVAQRFDWRVMVRRPGDGEAVRHTLSRAFSAQPGPGEGRLLKGGQGDLDTAAIWPNFAHPQWTWYVARFAFAKGFPLNLRGRLATSGQALTAMLHAGDEQQRTTAILDWCATGAIDNETLEPLAARNFASPWLNRMRSLDDEAAAQEIQTSPYPFEAAFFGTAGEVDEAAVPAGMVLIAARKAAAGNIGGTVAIDFGSTNTVAAFDDGKPITFAPRILYPVSSTDQAVVNRKMEAIEWPFVDFMPPAERHTPTPTVILGRRVDAAPELDAVASGEDDRLLFANSLYFQPKGQWEKFSADSLWGVVEPVLARAKFDLKWDEEPSVRVASQWFLRQLMVMIAAEAFDSGKSLSTLKWRFSRPNAMTDQVSFENRIRDALDDFVPGASGDNLLDSASEGACAANYILSGGQGGHTFNPAHLNVILDIGGSTTDIAIWVDRHLVWSGSYRLAGGQFFTNHLVNNPGLLKLFKLDKTWGAIINVVTNGRSRWAQSVGELLLSGPEFNAVLNARWDDNSDTAEVKALSRSALAFLGGIAWYLGLVVRGLIADGKISPDKLDNVAFALCGRGAGLFSRMHGDKPNRDTPVQRVLKLFAAAASPGQDRAPPSVFVSPNPKLEVVGGMIIENGAIDVALPRDRGPLYEPAGLNTPYGSGVLDAMIDIEGGPGGSPGRPDMAGFQAFLDALRTHGRFEIDIGEGGNQSVANSIQEHVLTSLNGHQYPPEPPFIMALRWLITFMTASNRDERLRVKDVTQGRR